MIFKNPSLLPHQPYVTLWFSLWLFSCTLLVSNHKLHFCTTYSIPWTKGKKYVYKFAITRKVVPEKVLEWPNIDTQPKKWNVQWLQWYIHYRTIGHVWPHPRAINIRASLGILCVVVTAVDIFKTRSMNRTARLSIWLIYMVCVNAHTLRSGQCSVVLASYCCVFAYGVVVN